MMFQREDEVAVVMGDRSECGGHAAARWRAAMPREGGGMATPLREAAAAWPPHSTSELDLLKPEI